MDNNVDRRVDDDERENDTDYVGDWRLMDDPGHHVSRYLLSFLSLLFDVCDPGNFQQAQRTSSSIIE